jgi:hypothetical protein
LSRHADAPINNVSQTKGDSLSLMEQPDDLPTYATPRQDLVKHIYFAPVISSTPLVKTKIMGQDISS